MGLFRSSVLVTAINFRRWGKDIRVYIVFLFIAVLIYCFLSPFTLYGIKSEQNCTVWMLPLLFQGGTISINQPKTLLHVGMLLLLCDAPFLSQITPYVVLRSQRNGWWIGECCYIIGTALIYTLFITGLSIIILLPVGIWGNDWGEMMKELAFGNQTSAGNQIAAAHGFQIKLQGNSIRFLYPQGSELYTFFAVWCSFSFLGLLMYLISLIKRSVLPGMCTAGLFIFLDPLLTWLGTGSRSWLAIFSPVCWTSVDQLRAPLQYRFMSIQNAIGLYMILIIILGCAIWRQSKRVVIEAAEAAIDE